MSIKNLKKLVEINSHSFNPKGLKACATFLMSLFDPLGAKKTQKKGVIFYEMRKKAPIQIVLGGHYDTVHAETSSFQKLKARGSEKIIGPGAADMKGGLLVLLEALKKFEASPFKDQIGWRLYLNPDEEIGSPNSGSLIQAFCKGALAAFIFEPALSDGSLVSSRKGSMNILIRSIGKSAHAGRDLEHGKNALAPLAHLIKAIDGTKGLNIVAMNGGSSFNTVPDEGILKLNYRSDHAKDFNAFEKRLKSLVKKYGLQMEIVSERPPKPFDKKTKKLFKALRYPVKLKASGGVTDGNLIAALGIPTIDTLGVIGGKLHTDEEYFEKASFKDRSELFYQFLIRLAKKEVTLC